MTLEEFNKLKDEGKIIDAASFPNCSDTESLCILWGAANPGCGHDGNCVVKGKIDHKFSCVGTKDYLSASCDIFGTVECANRPGTGWDGDIRFEIAVTAMGVMTCSPPPDENSIFNVYNGGF